LSVGLISRRVASPSVAMAGAGCPCGWRKPHAGSFTRGSRPAASSPSSAPKGKWCSMTVVLWQLECAVAIAAAWQTLAGGGRHAHDPRRRLKRTLPPLAGSSHSAVQQNAATRY
jgi:hypothetical protein